MLEEPGDSDDPVFHEEWERLVFGLSFCSWIAMGVAVDESRSVQASMPYSEYYGSSYYERWLYSLERLTKEKGDDAPRVDAHKLAAAVTHLAERGARRFREAPAPPEYSPGDSVRAKNVNPRTYDRLPAYVKGRRGEVEEHYGSFARPEDLAAGRTREPGAHCYRVRFGATELWGESAESPDDALCIDLFESYLETT